MSLAANEQTTGWEERHSESPYTTRRTTCHWPPMNKLRDERSVTQKAHIPHAALHVTGRQWPNNGMRGASPRKPIYHTPHYMSLAANDQTTGWEERHPESPYSTRRTTCHWPPMTKQRDERSVTQKAHIPHAALYVTGRQWPNNGMRGASPRKPIYHTPHYMLLAANDQTTGWDERHSESPYSTRRTTCHWPPMNKLRDERSVTQKAHIPHAALYVTGCQSTNYGMRRASLRKPIFRTPNYMSLAANEQTTVWDERHPESPYFTRRTTCHWPPMTKQRDERSVTQKAHISHAALHVTGRQWPNNGMRRASLRKPIFHTPHYMSLAANEQTTVWDERHPESPYFTRRTTCHWPPMTKKRDERSVTQKDHIPHAALYVTGRQWPNNGMRRASLRKPIFHTPHYMSLAANEQTTVWDERHSESPYSARQTICHWPPMNKLRYETSVTQKAHISHAALHVTGRQWPNNGMRGASPRKPIYHTPHYMLLAANDQTTGWEERHPESPYFTRRATCHWPPMNKLRYETSVTQKAHISHAALHVTGRQWTNYGMRRASPRKPIFHTPHYMSLAANEQTTVWDERHPESPYFTRRTICYWPPMTKQRDETSVTQKAHIPHAALYVTGRQWPNNGMRGASLRKPIFRTPHYMSLAANQQTTVWDERHSESPYSARQTICHWPPMNKLRYETSVTQKAHISHAALHVTGRQWPNNGMRGASPRKPIYHTPHYMSLAANEQTTVWDERHPESPYTTRRTTCHWPPMNKLRYETSVTQKAHIPHAALYVTGRQWTNYGMRRASPRKPIFHTPHYMSLAANDQKTGWEERHPERPYTTRRTICYWPPMTKQRDETSVTQKAHIPHAALYVTGRQWTNYGMRRASLRKPIFRTPNYMSLAANEQTTVWDERHPESPYFTRRTTCHWPPMTKQRDERSVTQKAHIPHAALYVTGRQWPNNGMRGASPRKPIFHTPRYMSLAANEQTTVWDERHPESPYFTRRTTCHWPPMNKLRYETSVTQKAHISHAALYVTGRQWTNYGMRRASPRKPIFHTPHYMLLAANDQTTGWDERHPESPYTTRRTICYWPPMTKQRDERSVTQKAHIPHAALYVTGCQSTNYGMRRASLRKPIFRTPNYMSLAANEQTTVWDERHPESPYFTRRTTCYWPPMTKQRDERSVTQKAHISHAALHVTGRQWPNNGMRRASLRKPIFHTPHYMSLAANEQTTVWDERHPESPYFTRRTTFHWPPMTKKRDERSVTQKDHIPHAALYVTGRQWPNNGMRRASLRKPIFHTPHYMSLAANEQTTVWDERHSESPYSARQTICHWPPMNKLRYETSVTQKAHISHAALHVTGRQWPNNGMRGASPRKPKYHTPHYMLLAANDQTTGWEERHPESPYFTRRATCHWPPMNKLRYETSVTRKAHISHAALYVTGRQWTNYGMRRASPRKPIFHTPHYMLLAANDQTTGWDERHPESPYTTRRTICYLPPMTKQRDERSVTQKAHIPHTALYVTGCQSTNYGMRRASLRKPIFRTPNYMSLAANEQTTVWDERHPESPYFTRRTTCHWPPMTKQRDERSVTQKAHIPHAALYVTGRQ